MKAKAVDTKMCYLLSSRIQGTKSARVRVSLECKEKVLDPGFWPQHVRVRSWLIRPRWANGVSSRSSFGEDGAEVN